MSASTDGHLVSYVGLLPQESDTRGNFTWGYADMREIVNHQVTNPWMGTSIFPYCQPPAKQSMDAFYPRVVSG